MVWSSLSHSRQENPSSESSIQFRTLRSHSSSAPAPSLVALYSTPSTSLVRPFYTTPPTSLDVVVVATTVDSDDTKNLSTTKPGINSHTPSILKFHPLPHIHIQHNSARTTRPPCTPSISLSLLCCCWPRLFAREYYKIVVASPK